MISRMPAVTLSLAVAFVASGYFYVTAPIVPPKVLSITSEASMEEIADCLGRDRGSATKAIALESACEFTGRCKPAKIYESPDGNFRVTLQRQFGSSELKVHSTLPLTAEQLSIFRECSTPAPLLSAR